MVNAFQSAHYAKYAGVVLAQSVTCVKWVGPLLDHFKKGKFDCLVYNCFCFPLADHFKKGKLYCLVSEHVCIPVRPISEKNPTPY